MVWEESLSRSLREELLVEGDKGKFNLFILGQTNVMFRKYFCDVDQQ